MGWRCDECSTPTATNYTANDLAACFNCGAVRPARPSDVRGRALPADVCPPCVDGRHSECMDDPEDGLRCACTDAFHLTAIEIEKKP